LECPVCGLEVEVPDDALPGEVIEHDCGAVLEVVKDGDGFRLRPLDEIKEDWGE
jgi:alpha-aminoadipate carrier protein LysW